MKTLSSAILKRVISDISSNKNLNTDDYQQAVIVHFAHENLDDDAFYNFMNKLIDLIKKKKLGIYDGHEIALDNSDGFLYMYGKSAEKLFIGIKPLLEETFFMEGATANLRFGPLVENEKEITVEIETNF